MMKNVTLILFAVSLSTIGLSQSIQKAVLCEFTGAWCGYCPDGAITMKNILDAQPDAIGVAFHNQDQMATVEGNSVDDFFNSVGYPGGVVNLKGAAIGRTSWTSSVNASLMEMAVATVSISDVSYDTTTRNLIATVNADFTLGAAGAYRLNLWLVEDSVVGTGTGYDQVSYFSSQAGHPLFGLGSPIAGYVHSHVLRKMVGTSWGTNNSVTNTAQGGHNSRTYSHTLSTGWNPDHMYLVGVLAKFDGSGLNQRKISNVEEVKLSEALSVSINDNKEVFNGISVYPNPFSEKLTIQFNLDETTSLHGEIIDLNGKVVSVIGHGIMNKGQHTLTWDGKTAAGHSASNGIYFVRISTESGKSFSGRVSLQR